MNEVAGEGEVALARAWLAGRIWLTESVTLSRLDEPA
jgi:hypothetical protein